MPNAVGWELTKERKPKLRLIKLATSMDPTKYDISSSLFSPLHYYYIANF